MRWLGHAVSWADVRRFVLASSLGLLPFAVMFLRAPDNFIRGYIGSKFVAEGNALTALGHNIAAAALALHVRGDSIFRSNPAALPHLDPISGLMFLVGVVFWLQPARRRWSMVLVVPLVLLLVLLHLPSVLVLVRPNEVPSAGRTLSMAPLAYILVASGIWWLGQYVAQNGWRRLSPVICGSLVAMMVVINSHCYFKYRWACPTTTRQLAGASQAMPTHCRMTRRCMWWLLLARWYARGALRRAHAYLATATAILERP